MTRQKPHITLGLPFHPRCRALIEGKVPLDGYEIEVTHDFASAGQRHHRFMQGEFDVGEMSTATFLRAIEKDYPFLALPIFFERGPRQRNIFYCEGNLNHPADLKGKKIGCFRYGATAVCWARGFLLDEHGLKTTDMGWYVSGNEVYIGQELPETDMGWYVSGNEVYIGQELPVQVERLDPPAPFGEEKLHLSRFLSEGRLHAAIVPGDSGYRGVFGGGSLPQMMGQFPGVKPLFQDTEEIIRHIKERRIYPIIHTIAIKKESSERHPDLPAKLIEAFREAKQLAAQYLSPEDIAGYEKEKEVLEDDPYACVLGETEKRTLRALMRYQIEQGLMKKELALEAFFVREAFV